MTRIGLVASAWVLAALLVMSVRAQDETPPRRALGETIFQFGTDVPEDQQMEIRRWISTADAHWGGAAGPLLVLAHSRLDHLLVAYKEECSCSDSGYAEAFQGAHRPPTQEASGAILILTSAPGWDDSTLRPRILSHSYFHAIQKALAGPNFALAPVWLMEGSASWADVNVLAANGTIDFDAYHEGARKVATALPPLSTMEQWGNLTVEPYQLGFLAVDQLSEANGPRAIVQFWKTLGEQADSPYAWQSAFLLTFGLKVEEFYAAFEEARQ